MWWAQARDTAHHSTVNRTTPVNKGLSSPVCQELRGWEILNPTSIQCSCFTQEDNWRLLLLLLRRFSVSNSVQPLRRQPTRLRCPWDSPGKNTGVGCHFLSNEWKWKVKGKSLSGVWLFATPWTAAYQAPPPMGFSRQEYWSGLPLPSPTEG